MKCSEVEEKLLQSMTGELGTEDRARLDRHLDKCESCRASVESTRRILDALGPPPATPQALEKRILTAVGTQAAMPRTIPLFYRIVRDFGSAAAVSATALLLFFLLAPVPKKSAPLQPTDAQARIAGPVTVVQAEEITTEEVRLAISRIGTPLSNALGGTLAEKVEQARENVEATRFMLTASGKTGLTREISSVKDRIQKLKDEMTTLALYTAPQQQNSVLDNGR